MDPKSVLLGLREKSVGLSKAQTRIPWREIINVHELQAFGIQDPVSFYKDEVSLLNQELSPSCNHDRERQISEETSEKLLDYFPVKNINESLSVKKYLDLMQTAVDFQFNVFSLLSSLIYSHAVFPSSKAKTFEEVLPKPLESCPFSLNQLHTGRR